MLRSLFWTHILVVLFACVHTESADNSNILQIVQLNKNELKIHGKSELPKGLMVKSPSGIFYYLVDLDSGIQHLDYKGNTEVTITISSQLGTYWEEGKRLTDIIFVSSGEYLIYFANNLETEPENTYSLQKTVHIEVP